MMTAHLDSSDDSSDGPPSSYSSLSGSASQKPWDRALIVWGWMDSLGLTKSPRHYYYMVQILGRMGDVSAAKDVRDEMFDKMGGDQHVDTTLAGYMADEGRWEELEEVRRQGDGSENDPPPPPPPHTQSPTNPRTNKHLRMHFLVLTPPYASTTSQPSKAHRRWFRGHGLKFIVDCT